jgi:RNA polymerase sigma-70 factor (ECF subfamily)
MAADRRQPILSPAQARLTARSALTGAGCRTQPLMNGAFFSRLAAASNAASGAPHVLRRHLQSGGPIWCVCAKRLQFLTQSPAGIHHRVTRSKLGSPSRGCRSRYEEERVSDFQMLLKEQLPRLIRYATALTRDADEALDLAEDTVLEALANDNPPSSDAELHAWLLTILHDQRANPFRLPDPLAPPSRPETGTASLGLSDLDCALGKLPEAQRAVILLAGLEGMSAEQMAAILRISVRAVNSRLARARENLCGILGVQHRELLPQAA